MNPSSPHPSEPASGIVPLPGVDTTGSTTPSMTLSPIDFDMIAEAAFDDPKRMREMLEFCLRELPRELTNLLTAVASRDVGRVARAAHKCRGVCAQAGFRGVVPALVVIEDRSRSGSIDGLAEYLRGVTEGFELCRKVAEARIRFLERSGHGG